MPRETVTKTLKDDYGEEHSYTLRQHPAEEGLDLLPVVLRFLGESGGPLADALFGSKSERELDEFSILDISIDGSKLGSAVTNFGEELAKAGGSEFCKRLLKYTTRTRKNPEGQEVEEKIPDVFGSIYQGNYGELAQAVWFAIEGNFGPCWRGRFDRDAIFERIVSLLRLGD